MLRKSEATSDQPQTIAAEQSGSRPDTAATPPEDDATSPAMQELHLTARQQTQLWDHVRKIENFWMTLPELEPGIIARIAKTARNDDGK